MSHQNSNQQQILISLDRHSEQQNYNVDTFNSSLNLQNSQISNSNAANPYQYYFSKRKEKQSNQSKNSQLLDAQKFLSAKSAQNIGFFPQSYTDNIQACGSVLSQAPHSNLVTSLSLASVNSVNSQNLLLNNQMQKSRMVNGSHLLGNGHQFPSYHAIITGSHTSTKKNNLGKTAIGLGANVIGLQFMKGGNSRNNLLENNAPGSQSVDEIENQKIQQLKNLGPVSKRQEEILLKNDNQFQQNNLFGSNKSSQSIQKSQNNNNIIQTNQKFQNNLQYLKKRDSSCQDGATKTFQPLQELFNNSKTKLIIQEGEKTQNNKFIKLSPQKQQIQSLGTKQSIAEESHMNYLNQVNIIKANNSTSSTNQSSSQLFGRNKKTESVLSGNLAKGQMLYMHQSSLNKLEQIKNIYSLQDRITAKQNQQQSSEYIIQPQSALDSINGGYEDSQLQNYYKSSQRNNKVIAPTSGKNSVYQNSKNQIKAGQLSLSRNSNASSSNQKNQTPGSLRNDFFKGVLLTQSISQNQQNTNNAKQEKTNPLISPINEQKSSFKTSNIQKTEFNSSKSFQNHHQKFIILNKQSLNQKNKQQNLSVKDKTGTAQQSIQDQMKQSDQIKNSRQQTIQNQSDNQSKINSYYNTKSSFGIRQSSCNYPSNSNFTKKQDFQQIKVKVKQQNNIFGNQTHKAIHHLNTQTDLKIIGAEKINNITSLRQVTNFTDILRNEDLQIKNEKFNKMDDQKLKIKQKFSNEQQEVLTKQNVGELQGIEKRQEKTEKKEDLSNSFQIDINENKTNTINNTLQKKLQNPKPSQKSKKQDQNQIPKDQKLLSEKINHAHQNQLIKQKIFDLEITNSIKLKGDFKNNQEIDKFLKKQINSKLPASEASLSINREKFSSSINYMIDNNNQDLNIKKSQDEVENGLPTRNVNQQFQSKDKLLKSQVSKTRSKIDEIQEINDRKLQNLDIKSNENLENEGQNNIKAFKTPYVANKKSTNQVDQLNVNYNKLYENSSKSNYLKSENNHQKLPDIFKNNFQIQSKSEQKLNAIILNNNQVELSSKKHLKSYDLLAVEAQRNIDVSSAIKSNEQLIQDLKQNNMSRGENLNFEFQKFNRLQDAKSENGANLSPSRQLTSDQIQLKTKLKYNELLKMNADIKKKNIQFLNDKLGKMNRKILQADSNSVCYQNEQSNDTQNSINFKMINDEEDINQIQNNSYDSLLPNKNINGSFETYSNKVLPQSVSLNIYSQKFVNLEKINKTKRNLPTTVENQSYSSLEQQIKNYDLKQKQDELVSNQMMNHGMVQNNSTISLNYKDQKNQETLTDIQQKKQKEKKLNDESRHGPGTANTHGGYMRQNYKQKQQLENNLQDFNVNFKDSSLQCKSEIVKMNFEQNSSAVNQNFQQISYLDQMPVYNINSDFDRSFEIMDPMNFHNSEFHYPNQQQKNNFYRQNQEINNDMKSHQIGQHDNNLINFMHYQNKGGIGEGVITDNMSSIPSIHSIPVIRNQKSQATYRHGHQKISEVLNKYYHNNYGNSSLQQINNSGFSDTSKSEVYRNFLKIQQSQASAPILAGQLNQEIYSQMNDHQINTTQISQLSHDSEMVGMMDLQNFQRHPGTKHEVYRNKKKHFDGKDGAFSGDDRHPFNGPKLHLFRKGQSKSSQAKLRKIKRSQQNVKLNEINPVAGFSQIPGNQITQNQNKNEQDIYNDINYKQKFDNDLNNSVENGSSIKNQNNQNQLSKNGHINISEILNGKIKLQPPLQYQGQNKIYTDLQSRNSFRSKKSNDLEGDSQFFQEQYKEQNLNNEDNISYNKILNNQSLEIKKKNINLNQQIAYDSDSQNCRSQLTTICQNPGIQQESIKQYENQQIVVGRETLLPLHVFANKRQSQQTNDTKQNILINNQFQDLNQIDFDEILKQQSQERKSVEDERQNELNTSQKTISNKNISVKPLKNTNQQGSNFQHPKVGKNSKHPQVFRNNINHINSQKSKKSNAKIENENSLNLKTQMINLTFNNNFPIELHHSKSHQNLLKEQQINNQQMSPGFKFLSSDQHSFKDLKYQNNEQNMSKLSDIKKDEQQNKMLGNEIIEKKQQKIQQLKDQNTIFATTFEAFNQKQLEKQQIENEQNYRAFVQTFSEQTEKIEVQKQCFNVQKYSDDKNEIVAASEDQVQIKVRFNENFDYQNSEIDKNQFKRLAVSSKTELKKSLTEEQIQYKREQVHQNQSMNTFDYQSNDQILKNNINHNQDTILISNQVIGINSINSVMSSAMPIQKQNHKQIKVDAQSDLKENEKIKLETEKMRQTHHSEMEVNRIETSSEINGMNLNNTQKSHSIAQTPCFAETPNTTDQFKGYKIDITD